MLEPYPRGRCRLTRAEQLLPRPLEENSVNVAVALDVLRWRGGEEPKPG